MKGLKGVLTVSMSLSLMLFSVSLLQAEPGKADQDHAKQMQACMKDGKSHEQCMKEQQRMKDCMKEGKSQEQCQDGMQHDHNHAY